MSQLLSPEDYAGLRLPDQWIEDEMQRVQALRIDEWLARYSVQTVLELGYGSGIVTRSLVASGRKVTTVDGAAAFAEFATLDGAVGVHSLFEDYHPGVRFDCTIASFVLEHVENPVRLLTRTHEWGGRLIVAIGNANSWHRQLAVQMGLQPKLATLSERDKAVGHYCVFEVDEMLDLLWKSGWSAESMCGVMFKPLPNSMLVKLPTEVVKAMCELPVSADVAANSMMFCVPR